LTCFGLVSIARSLPPPTTAFTTSSLLCRRSSFYGTHYFLSVFMPCPSYMGNRKRRRTMVNEDSPSFVDTNGLVKKSDATKKKQGADGGNICVRGVSAIRKDNLRHSPQYFSAIDCGDFLGCDDGGLTVYCKGDDDDDKFASSARTNVAIPTVGIACFYFEVHVDSAGCTGDIGIGLSCAGAPLNILPGWKRGSILGYHGDDGNLFSEKGEPCFSGYGPTFSTGDTIGCCWNMVDEYIFFTKNGQHLGRAFGGPKLQTALYPTVGMRSAGGQLSANFGSKPFKYDIETYARHQRERTLKQIKDRPLGNNNILEKSILEHLIHAGYSDTAAVFASAIGKTECFNAERRSMMERHHISNLIASGDIDSAVSILHQKYPAVFAEEEGGREVAFLLRSQQFIQIIETGKGSRVAALEAEAFGKASLAEFHGDYGEQLEKIYSLLAYSDPGNSPNRHLMGQPRRNSVAAKIGRSILRSQGKSSKSPLEELLVHTEKVIRQGLRCKNGSMALVHLRDFL